LAGSTAEEDVKNIVIKRLDAIKNKDEGAVRTLFSQRYSKFDDWPPYERQDSSKALENEFGAFKVLSNYSYELKDFRADIFGDTAIATFIIHYHAVLRNAPYDVTSRVTAIVIREFPGWKIAHEHYSRFPDVMQRQQFMPRRGMQP